MGPPPGTVYGGWPKLPPPENPGLHSVHISAMDTKLLSEKLSPVDAEPAPDNAARLTVE